jgi:hypothetical protein
MSHRSKNESPIQKFDFPQINISNNKQPQTAQTAQTASNSLKQPQTAQTA